MAFGAFSKVANQNEAHGRSCMRGNVVKLACPRWTHVDYPKCALYSIVNLKRMDCYSALLMNTRARCDRYDLAVVSGYVNGRALQVRVVRF